MRSEPRTTETAEAVQIFASSDGPGAVSDDEAFRRFYEDEHGEMVRRATLLTGSVDTAHDVVHEAFAQLWRRWGTIESPGPYLQRSVVNGARDQHRRTTRDRGLRQRLRPVAAVPEPSHDPDLARALATLPFNHRAAVVLRYYGGLTEREIAAQLDCAPGSVGPWIRRGLDRLQEELS